ncbi:predicted protein [Nematostella vectensis]|uniref:Uncharacterized protein n=1 Tax=Nematostella vectensis TaxID=45351 RepID=A7S5X4_NEMVE|nr:predicted protein [Nematostella vectensis]|eukprot:XP_001632943.1 predicted protein [Nematostella vectensis]
MYFKVFKQFTFPLPTEGWQRQVCPKVTEYKSWEGCPIGTGNECTSDDDCARAGTRQAQRCCPSECGVKCTAPVAATSCPIPIDLAMVLDSSGSIGKKDWVKLLEFTKSVVDAYSVSEEATHVGVITYSTEATLDIAFDKYSGVEMNSVNLKKDIDIIPQKNNLTFMDKALELANSVLFTEARGMRPNKKQVCLFLTDGIQTFDQGPYTKPSIVSQKLKDRGIDVYTVGVGDDVDLFELLSISSGDKYTYSAKNFDELQAKVQEILQEQCTGCKNTLDLVFGIPNSQSLGSEITNVKQVMSRLAGLFDVANSKAHIGLVAYDQGAHMALPLDKAYSVGAVQQAINNLATSKKHGFDTAAAIKVAADHAFSMFGGVRQTQPKVFVLFAPRGSTSTAAEIKEAAEKLKKNGIRLMVVGIDNSADTATYSSAVTQPAKRFLMNTKDYDDLNAAVWEIADTVCKSAVTPGKCRTPDAGDTGGAQCEVDKDCGVDQLCCDDGSGKTSCKTAIKNCFVPFEMAIAMDASETVSRQDFVRMKSFVRDLMWPNANSENNIHFGLMTFAGTTKKVTEGFRKFRSEQELDELLDKIEKTQDPQRRVDKTFKFASKEFFSMEGGTRHGHERYLLVLASDATSPGSGDLNEAAKDLDLLNVKRIAVATNSDVQSTFLRAVASDDKYVYQAKSTDELGQVSTQINQILCKEKPGKCKPVESPVDPVICRGTLPNPSRIPCGDTAKKFGQSQQENDWDCPGETKCCPDETGCFSYCTHPPLEYPNGKLICSSLFPIACDKHRDLLIMVENTDAIGDQRSFGLVKDFTSKLIGAFDISRENTHVAVGTYRSSGRSVVRFNDAASSSKDSVLARLERVTFQGGTYGLTKAALSTANDIFDAKKGMRPGQNKTLVIIGTGHVDEPQQARELAQDLRSNMIDIFAVTIGDDANYRALRDVVSREAAKNVFAVTSGDALVAQLRALVNTVCDGAYKDLIVSI